MTFLRRAGLASMVTLATALGGCTTLLGDFQVGAGDDASTGGDGGGTGDGQVGSDGGDGGGGDSTTMNDGPAPDTRAGHLVLDKTTLDFATHTLNSMVPAMTVTVTNTGTAATATLTVTVTGSSFGRSGGTCMGPLAPTASCTVDVTINTTRTGMQSGSVVIADGASDMVSASLAGNIVMACPSNMPTLCSGSTCVDIVTDPLNCNTCGNRCPTVPNGTGGCAASRCGVGMCNTGFQDCNGIASDGCEVGTTNDPAHCGSCAGQCTIPNGTPGCVNSTCTVATCTGAFKNCNSNPVDGCESDTNTDLAHCGSCITPCAPANATPACSSGTCRIASCNVGFRDCNAMVSDGCEINTNTDNMNCGGCGAPCTGGRQCSAAVCACTGGTPDLCGGACTNSQTDAANCGACGHSCLGGTCAGGACQPLVLYNITTGSGQGLAVDATSVYFTDGASGHLYKCPLSGCAGNPTVLRSGLTSADSVYYDAGSNSVFVADGTSSVFYNVSTSGTLIYSVNVSGSFAGYTTPRAFFADASFVYWGNNGNANTEIDKAAKSNGSGVAINNPNIAASKGVWSLAYDGTSDRLFSAVFSANLVSSCPRGGGACSVLGTNPLPTGVSVVGNRIFISVRGTSPGYNDGGIYTATTTLASPAAFAIGPSYAILNGTLTADPNFVYWGGQSGKIYRCAVGGCGGVPTAITPTGMFFDENFIVNDMSAIYWVGGGSVVKLAK